MVPYELILHNFMCYRDNLPPLRLDGLHVSCLSGENGAGKSALLDAITWALWGQARMSDDELIAQGASDMRVELRFVLGSQHYRVIRHRQRGKTTKSGRMGAGKSALDFQIWDDSQWRTISENTLSETQQQIDQVLCMKFDTFINASFLLQGRADEFTRKTAGERTKVLADILNLHEYDVLEARARQRARAVTEKLLVLDGEMRQLEHHAAQQEQAAQFVAEAEASVSSLGSAAEQAAAAQQQADEQVRALEVRAAEMKRLSSQVLTLRDEQHQQQQEIAEVQREIASDETLLQRRDEIAAGMTELAAARAELERVEGLRPQYDRLWQQRRDLQDQLKDARHALQVELAQQRSSVQQLQAQVERRPRLEQDLQQVEQQLTELAPLAAQVEQLYAQRQTLDERISRVNRLLLHHRELDSSIAQQRDRLTAERDEQQRLVTRLQDQLRDADRWQIELEAAETQERSLTDVLAQRDALREQEQQIVDAVSALRATRDGLEQQAEQLKQRKQLLTNEEATTCPLCGSSLGDHGVATMLHHYEQEITNLRQRYRARQQQADAQETGLDDLRERLRKMQAMAEQVQRGAAQVPTLRQQVDRAQAWRDELEQARAALNARTEQLTREDYAHEVRAALHAVENDLRQQAADGASTPEDSDWLHASAHLEQQRASLDAERAALEQRLQDRTSLESKAAALHSQLTAIAQAAAELPAAENAATELERKIQDNDFAHDIRQIGRAVEADIAALGYTDERHTAARTRAQALEQWKDEQHRLELAGNRLESNRRILQRSTDLYERRAAEIVGLEEQVQQLEHELRALPAAQRQAQECRETATRCRNTLRVAQDDLIEKQSMQRRAQQASDELSNKQGERETLVKRQGLLQELTEAWGKKGVQAMLIETAIPEIEREANRLLGRITDNQMHVTFEMQRSTRKGDTVETLEIKIADALGTRTYDAFSGGEATRINFAIRIALSRLLARRAGASLETLVIDEGMSALDAAGRERFVEAITSVQHDFKRILVVTHLDDLKDRFPARIEITKTPAGSQWELV